MKYFLTTAIDFVNSRPHLGTAYEKITADIIARYRRLAGFDTHFLMGNDEHSQNVFRKAAEQGKDPLAYCDEMEQVFRDVWKRLDLSFDDFIRTTDREAALSRRAEDGAGLSGQRRHLRGRVRRLVLRGLRGLQAGEGSGRGQLSDPQDQAAVDQGEELVLPPLEVSAAAAEALRRPSVIHRAGHPPQRDPAAGRRRPRRHLDEPRRAVVGHSGAVRSDERGLRVVRRADQLRGGGRLRLGRRALQEMVARQPARRRQGHHALPLRDLAGDADERAACRCRRRCSATAGCTSRASA